jgi:hypothetical protein
MLAAVFSLIIPSLSPCLRCPLMSVLYRWLFTLVSSLLITSMMLSLTSPSICPSQQLSLIIVLSSSQLMLMLCASSVGASMVSRIVASTSTLCVIVAFGTLA